MPTAFHLNARPISRGKGQNAIKAAAYLSRSQLEDERTGFKTRDYSEREDLKFEGIFLPKDAPEWMRDRDRLWNAVEAREDDSNRSVSAQSARRLIFALPHELTDQQREWIVKDFVRENFARAGMVADVAIHAPHAEGDERNHHAHVLLTMRKIDLDNPHGFGNKERAWDKKTMLDGWREDLAKKCGRALERAGYEQEAERWRHGHETLEKQREAALARGDLEFAEACDKEAARHLGPAASAMLRDGIETELSHANDEITRRNAERAAAKAELRDIQQDIEREEGRARDEANARTADEQPHDTTATMQNEPKPEEDLKAQPQKDENDKADPEAERQAKIEELARQNARREADELEALKAIAERHERMEAYRRQMEQEAEDAKKRAEEEKQRRADEERSTEHSAGSRYEPRSATTRYSIALGETYNLNDPYGSLARTAMRENADFMRDREQLKKMIDNEADPTKREALELRRDIEAADYMAESSRRIARIWEVNHGDRRDRPVEMGVDEAARYDEKPREQTEGERLRGKAAFYDQKKAEMQEKLAEKSQGIRSADAERTQARQAERMAKKAPEKPKTQTQQKPRAHDEPSRSQTSDAAKTQSSGTRGRAIDGRGVEWARERIREQKEGGERDRGNEKDRGGGRERERER